MARAENSAALLKKVTTPAANRTEVGTAKSPMLEASHGRGQFGPLPSVIRPSLASEEQEAAARRNGRRRAAIVGLLPAFLIAASVAWLFVSASAQQPSPKPPAAAPAKGAPAAPPKQQPAQTQPAQQQAQQQQPAMPVSTEQALYLIRSTLLTLNDANRSGNYTVLRDLAAPDFQARNTAADLSQIFSDLRRRNFDLYGAALLAPQLTAVPARDQRGYLHLTGFFPTRPQQINFDLLFQDVGNQWRLFGVAITTPDATAAGR
jgi:hypothetical protein